MDPVLDAQRLRNQLRVHVDTQPSHDGIQVHVLNDLAQFIPLLHDLLEFVPPRAHFVQPINPLGFLILIIKREYGLYVTVPIEHHPLRINQLSRLVIQQLLEDKCAMGNSDIRSEIQDDLDQLADEFLALDNEVHRGNTLGGFLFELLDLLLFVAG